MLMIGLLPMVSGCTRQGATTPEQTLEQYIRIGLDAKGPGDKAKLLELTIGEAHEELGKMKDKEFNDIFVEKKLRYLGYKARDLRQENSGEVSLIYELSYEEQDAAGAAIVTNRKIAYLAKDDEGRWKIKGTKNVKSFVERKDALEVLGESAPASAK